MLTHVTDHKLQKPIPVEYIEPGEETLAQKYEHMNALVASIVAAQAEYVAINEGEIDCVHVFNPDSLDKDFLSIENGTLDRIIDAREALDLHLQDWIGFEALKSDAA